MTGREAVEAMVGETALAWLEGPSLSTKKLSGKTLELW